MEIFPGNIEVLENLPKKDRNFPWIDLNLSMILSSMVKWFVVQMLQKILNFNISSGKIPIITRKLRYCTTKINMGQKWYQSTAYGFLLFRWTFFSNLQ
jgi:hypothetical protein